jgi:CRISPR-associated protein Csx17
MPEQVRTLHHLEGLRAQPLASYLTALAVLRLVHEQRDPTVSGAWCDGYFVLDTVLEREELLRFFLEEYQPTPLTSPWNGGSGYFPKDNKDGFNAILTTDQPRFAPYRQTLENVRALLTRMGIKEKPEGEDKTRLLRALRATLDDHSLKWLDAAVVLTDENGLAQPRYAPLLGTGGNDGRLEFSNNQMKRLADMFLSKKAKPQEHTELLEAALFGTLSQYLRGGAIGQFDPGSAGGVNLSTGFEGGSLINPWYYLFMVEGALVMAAAAVGRLKDPGRTGAAFPFTVSHLGAGHGKLGSEEGNRQELWLPLWERPAGYAEVQALFGEGRAQVGSKQARNPVEFSLALASRGTTRGLSGFSRFGFLQRNGKSFFATPLGYHPVKHRDNAGLLRQVESWFASHRHQLKKPESAARAIRRYDNAVMEHLSGGNRSLTDVLERLGELHALLARTPKLWETVRPLPPLDGAWVKAAYASDESVEFRLALSLSTLGSSNKGVILPLRSQLSPYDAKTRQWDSDGWITRWTGRDLPERMLGLLRHRLLLAQRAHEATPLWGFFPANRADIERFIEGRVDDQRLERLLFALSLVPPARHSLPRQAAPDFLPLPYLLPKLALHQGRSLQGAQARDGPGRDRRIPPAQIVHLLSTGRVGDALRASRRFLIGRDLVIPLDLTNPLPMPVAVCRRMAAALLFPISDKAYEHIALNVLQIESEMQSKEREE